MEELLYDVTTLARIIREHNMSVKETYAFYVMCGSMIRNTCIWNIVSIKNNFC